MRERPETRYSGILFAMLLSGSAALIYETVWARALGCYMGGTAETVALVLAAFMGGMAFGSWLAGGRADSSPNPLRDYGAIELSLAAAGVLVPHVIPIVGQLYIDLALDLGPGPLLVPIRGGLFLALLALPAVAMGATFPLACRAGVTANEQAATRVATLYAINSAGAVLGCLACGLWLIPALGLTLSSVVGAAFNTTAGLLGLVLARSGASGPGRETSDRDNHRKDDEVVGTFANPASLACLAGALPFHLFVSGFTAMAYEVAFTRLLPLVIGASTYSFTIMLAAFITGIARGARALSRLSVVEADRILSRCQLRLGITILLSLPLLSLSPFAYVLLKCGLHPPFPLFLFLVFALAFLVMSYPAYHLGMVIPAAAIVHWAHGGTLGRGIGRAYAANTIGNVAGALLCALVLLPGLGLHRTFVAMALLNVACGLALSRFHRLGVEGRFRLGIVLALAVTGAWPEFHPALLAGGAFRTSRGLSEALGQVWSHGAFPIVYRRDDANASVIVQQRVTRERTFTFLKVAGKVDASDASDMHTQLMLAHAPLGLHPRPRRVLVIGLGSGVTTGAALCHPIDHVDAAEISDGVICGSAWFAHVNRRYWNDSRCTIVQDDARHLLSLARLPYDVIISEPSNPWMAGIVNLYTREFFGLAANRLEGGGLFCQWIHTYEMSREVFCLILKTFQEVFPHVRVFLTGTGADVLIVGSLDPIEPSEASVGARYREPAVRDSLATIGIRSPLTPIVLEVFDRSEARAFCTKATAVTDDWPLLEYLAPQTFYRGERVDLPLAGNLASRGHLWRLWRDRGLDAAEADELLKYAAGILPASARSAVTMR